MHLRKGPHNLSAVLPLPLMPRSGFRQKVRALGRLRANEHTTMTLLAILVGLLGGYGAVGFRYLIQFFQSFFYGAGDNLLELATATPWPLRILIPAAGGLVVGPVVYWLASEAKGHGVPEVMEAVALKSGMIRKRVVLIKSLVSAVCNQYRRVGGDEKAPSSRSAPPSVPPPASFSVCLRTASGPWWDAGRPQGSQPPSTHPLPAPCSLSRSSWATSGCPPSAPSSSPPWSPRRSAGTSWATPRPSSFRPTGSTAPGSSPCTWSWAWPAPLWQWPSPRPSTDSKTDSRSWCVPLTSRQLWEG